MESMPERLVASSGDAAVDELVTVTSLPFLVDVHGVHFRFVVESGCRVKPVIVEFNDRVLLHFIIVFFLLLYD